MNTLKTAFFLGLLSALIVAIGGALGGRGGLVMAFGIAAVMNFYTESCPESTRPRELNKHLYGDR